MERVKLTPAGAATAMGAYSHGLAVDVGDATLVFVTGQIAIDADGNVVSDDVAEQTRFVFERIAAILGEAGASMDNVVKAQIFLTDIDDFGVVSPIRDEFFATSEPVSTLLEVSNLVKAGCKIEVEVVAIRGRTG